MDNMWTLFYILVLTNGFIHAEVPCSCPELGNYFMCTATTPGECTCIPMHWKCDKDVDCELGDDERNCDLPSCGSEQFTCTNSKCIRQQWTCDGDNDCGDESDEVNCPALNCTSGQFHCDNGRCIRENWLCDGDDDCGDGSDEICPERTCGSAEFACGDGSCISMAWHCDSDIDCKDASDENHCDNSAPCREDEFHCDNGHCILDAYRCDLQMDCSDGSDETNCDATPAVICGVGEFMCDNGDCINSRWSCDGDPDCDDQSDERNCPAQRCESDEFRCGTGRCIDGAKQCDQQIDCSDNSDEFNCGYEEICSPGQFRCHDKACIGMSKVCNGLWDCLDGSDELQCNSVLSCKSDNGGCSHQCRHTNNGTICSCPTGFELQQDRRTCHDFDECLIDGKCSQVCTNAIGSFVCSCVNGYQLRPDGRTCKAIGGEPLFLFANRIDIRRFTLSNSRYASVVKNLDNAIAVDYHHDNGDIYWSDVAEDKIRRSTLNGTSVRDVITTGLSGTGGLAVDWVHNKLFWTDSGTSRIEVSNLDGTLRKSLIWRDIEKPRAIAAHPKLGCIFWTDWGQEPKIERSSMDGKNRLIIADRSLFWPNGLTLDYATERVYWVDAKHRVIESADLNGRDRKVVISSGLPHPFALTVFEDDLYWTDWHTLSINKANKFNEGAVEIVRSNLHSPMDIHSVHAQRQPTSENKCGSDNGGCSHLCLPNEVDYSCACPTGFMLLPDQKQCAENIKNFLLFARKRDIRRISFDTESRVDTVIELAGVQNALDIDWHSDTDYIYWSDIATNTISRSRWDASGQEVIIDTSLESPTGLAVDWIAQNLYIVDAGLDRIEVCQLDGRLRSLLLWENMDRPRDIVLDPEEGFLYWSDWGTSGRIEKAGMDGTQRQTILNDLKWPNGLAIDFETKRLYWTDAGRNTLEYSDLDGTNRHVLISSNLPHPFGLAIFKDYLYWTDWDTKTIEMAHKIDGSERHSVATDLEGLMDIHMFHRERPIVENPCVHDNGGCSHLCVLSPGGGSSCVCPTGTLISEDGNNCQSKMDNFLIMACRSDLRVISLDTGYHAEVVLPIYGTKHAIAVAVDTIEEKVYWSDSELMLIQRAKLDGTELETVIDIGLHTPDGLVIDSTGRKMYWTDTGTNRIEVSTLDGKIRKVLVWHDLDSPRAIALDYGTGMMYWTDWGNRPRIERADMDGNNRITLIDTDLMWPNGLTIDRPTSRIIWADARTMKIECADLNGNNRRVLAEDVPHPYGLTVAGDFIYWTDWKLKAVGRADKLSGEWSKLQGTTEGLMAIHAVQISVKEENVCGADNGGCSHLCLRKPGGFTCACPTGLLLREDAKTCHDMPTKFLLFASRGSLRTISMDTPDSSDVILPLPDLHNAIALDFDYTEKRVYYTDLYLDVIRRAYINGSGVETIVDKELSTTDGIAVDWIAHNLYWTDTGRDVIEVSRMNGSSRKVVVKGNLDEPRAIVLYPKKGLMFWSDWGVKPRIERASLDGTSRTAIVADNLGWPNGLCIDFASKRIYWADAKLDRIETSDLNGENRVQLVTNLPHPFGLAVYGSSIYMTDWQGKTIERFDKNTGKNRAVIQNNMANLMDIKVVAPDKQLGTNACANNNGNCTHLCLARASDYVCACPDFPDRRPCSVKPGGVVYDPSENDIFDLDSYECSREAEQKGLCDTGGSGHRSSTATVAYVLGALLTVLLISLCLIVLVVCRRKKKRRDLEHQNVRFNNPTYHQAPGEEATVSIRPRPRPKRRLFRYFKNEERLQEVGANCEQKPNNQELAALLRKQPNCSQNHSANNMCSACCENSAHAHQCTILHKKPNKSITPPNSPIGEQDCCACSEELGAAANVHNHTCKSDLRVNVCKLDTETDEAPPTPPQRLDSKNIFSPDQAEKDMGDKDTKKVLCDKESSS